MIDVPMWLLVGCVSFTGVCAMYAVLWLSLTVITYMVERTKYYRSQRK